MIGGNTWYDFCVVVVRSFYWTLGGVTSVGAERIPETGPVLLAANHLSHLDPPIAVIGQNRHLWVMAKEELFKFKPFGSLIGSIQAFPVKRGAGDIESIRKAIEFLASGDGVLIFPEGTRGDGKTLLPLNKGVATLAKRSGATVVPVGIQGTQHVLPKGKSITRGPMKVVYGEPFTFDEVAGGGSAAEQRDRFMAVLEERILQACKDAGLDLVPSSQ